MIQVFRLRATSKLMTGIEGPFDTRELEQFLAEHKHARIVSSAALDDVTLLVVVQEDSRK